MNIDEVKREIEAWRHKSDSQLRIFSIDENTKRISFDVPNEDTSFYINQEVAGDGEPPKWLVWSDDENTLRKLQTTIEAVTSNRLTSIASILASCESCLFKKTSGTAEKEKAACDKDDVDDDEDYDEDDEDEDVDNYYDDAEDFIDDMKETVTEKKHEDSDDLEDDDDDVDTFFGAMNTATSAAIQRLRKDLKNILKVGPDLGIDAMPRGNNMFLWDVKLKDVPTDSRLGKDLQQYAKTYKKEAVLTLEMQFPPDYPFNPPFIRVIKPRFKFLTGHVTIGGSICMEMLTKSGWVPSNDIESILVQVRAEILSDPNAGLDFSRADVAYTEQEARDAFNRMVSRYGWNK